MDSNRRQFIQTCLRWAALGLCPFLPGVLTARLSTAAKPNQASEPLRRSGNRRPARIDPDFEPAYLSLHRSGELKGRGDILWQMMSECALCPRQCGADRLAGDTGFCRASARLQIASFQPHFGEERSLVGTGGSGTIFMSHCGLRCVFCINWQISHGGAGRKVGIDDLARMMLHLQEIGCHNINVVTPTHFSPHIVRALDKAAANGLRLPLVYNTCGWERLEILQLLDGIVNIYLPDFKYADGRMADAYSAGAESYPELTQTALLEMHRQVGVAKPAADGIMYRGLMIRHLVMPNNVGGTQQVVEWIAEHLPKDTYVNIMSQYRPMYRAEEFPKIARRLTRKEYQDAVRWAREAGLTHLDVQGALFLLD